MQVVDAATLWLQYVCKRATSRLNEGTNNGHHDSSSSLVSGSCTHQQRSMLLLLILGREAAASLEWRAEWRKGRTSCQHGCHHQATPHKRPAACQALLLAAALLQLRDVLIEILLLLGLLLLLLQQRRLAWLAILAEADLTQ